MNLTEASRLIETEDDPGNNPHLRKFSDDVQNAGIGILNRMGDVYVKDAKEFMCGVICASLEESGDPDGIFILAYLYSNPDLFTKLSVDILKFGVGLAALEELR